MGICLDQWTVSISLFSLLCTRQAPVVLICHKINIPFTLLVKTFQFFQPICGWAEWLLKSSFDNFIFSFVMCLLLIKAGDIESNPGPGKEYSLYLLHLNIRSIRKIDFLSDNFSDFDYKLFGQRGNRE